MKPAAIHNFTKKGFKKEHWPWLYESLRHNLPRAKF